MAGLNDIIKMCKDGKLQEAYELAKADLEAGHPWGQLTTGWALRYLLEDDARNGRYDQLVSNLDELFSLDQIPQNEIEKINENVIFWIGYLAKKSLTPTGFDTPTKLSTLFNRLKDKSFAPGRGYSMLLEGFIRCDAWQELADFFEWWDLDKLTPDDYKPVQMNNGKKIMSVAERAFIAKSKALLRLNDLGRIEEFLPQMDTLMNNHPEMTYPGYFYGKLLLSLGSTPEDALKVIVPFAKKKSTEFWVWQLLSDVFTNDQDKQLACLIRAVHCRTQENFLGKVRIKLATLYIQRNQLDLAKFQIDKVTQCYLSQGWHVPYEVDCWIHQDWIQTITSSDKAPVDYMAITNEILGEKTEEAVAVVTYVDQNSHKAAMVYGYEKRMSQKLRFRVDAGAVLKLNFVIESNDKQRILNAGKYKLPTDLNYAKKVEGTIKKRTDWAFAFLHYGNEKAFISPNVVSKYNVVDGESVKCLIVYDFDKKKNSWNWVVVNVNR